MKLPSTPPLEKFEFFGAPNAEGGGGADPEMLSVEQWTSW
jgi:hypothetical protein